MVFRIQDVTVFRGQKKILDTLRFDIEEGSLNYITGLNGSGKTTLLQVLCKMLPYQGSIFFYEKELRNFSASDLTRHVSVVHQLNTQPFEFTVEEFILLGRFNRLKFAGSYGSGDYQALEYVTEKLGLDIFRQRKLNSLSGGELQKVYIAQALIRETRVLLLDEPSRFLDPLNRMELYHLLQQLSREGITILCITHDSEPFEQKDARVLGFRAGRLVWDGGVGEKKYTFSAEVYGMGSTSESSPS